MGVTLIARLLKDRPLGVRQNLEPPDQEGPYRKDSKIIFSQIISNRFFWGSEFRSDLDHPHRWENFIQGFYQPIIKATFERHKRQEMVPIKFEKGGDIKKICFPYNKDESLIDEEGSRCAEKVYKAFGLKIQFYQDTTVAEATRPHKTSTNGPQQSTVRPQDGGAVSTSTHPVLPTQAEKVPAKRITTRPSKAGSFLGTKLSPRTQAQSRAPEKQLPIQTLSSTAEPPDTSIRGTAGDGTSTQTSGSKPRVAKSATSARAVGSKKPRIATKNTTAKEVANQNSANIPRKRTTASGLETTSG